MVKIDIKKRHVYFLIGLLSIVGFSFVMAQVIPNPGHNPFTQLSACAPGTPILKSDGINWGCSNTDDLVGPAGADGATGADGADGADGASGAGGNLDCTNAVGNPMTHDGGNPPSQFWSATATCPGGYFVTGGGGHCDGSLLAVTTPSGNGWVATCDLGEPGTEGSKPAGSYTYARCCRII